MHIALWMIIFFHHQCVTDLVFSIRIAFWGYFIHLWGYVMWLYICTVYFCTNLKMTYDDRLVFCHFFFQELKWWYRNKIFLECSLRKMQTATFTVSYQPVFDYRSMLHWIYTFVIFHQPSSKLLSYYHWGIIVHKKWFNE